MTINHDYVIVIIRRTAVITCERSIDFKHIGYII